MGPQTGRPVSSEDDGPWWRRPSGLALFGFLVVAGFFLASEHRAHLFGILPWLLVLACPLMHLFMHHGHDGHQGHGGSPDRAPPQNGRDGPGGESWPTTNRPMGCGSWSCSTRRCSLSSRSASPGRSPPVTGVRWVPSAPSSSPCSPRCTGSL